MIYHHCTIRLAGLKVVRKYEAAELTGETRGRGTIMKKANEALIRQIPLETRDIFRLRRAIVSASVLGRNWKMQFIMKLCIGSSEVNGLT